MPIMLGPPWRRDTGPKSRIRTRATRPRVGRRQRGLQRRAHWLGQAPAQAPGRTGEREVGDRGEAWLVAAQRQQQVGDAVARGQVVRGRPARVDLHAVAVRPLAAATMQQDRPLLPHDPCTEAAGLEHEPGAGVQIARVVAENPGQVAAYRGGKEGLLGFFVGQVLKETGGKANARIVSELVRVRLRA